MILHIKNMVCDRCILSVRKELEKLGIPYSQLSLGQVEMAKSLDTATMNQLRTSLENLGFELLDDRRSQIVEEIKSSIIELIHHADPEDQQLKLSVIIAERLGMDYHYLSTLFSQVEGKTIEKYAILQRVERVKELISYGEKKIGDIAYEMGYSSVQHLSQQFKKITGLSPSQFKNLSDKPRQAIDKL